VAHFAVRTLLLVLVAACGRDLRPSRPPSVSQLIVHDTFDDGDGRSFSRHWQTDMTSTSRSAVVLSPGRRGNGLRITTPGAGERAVRVFRTLDAVPLRGTRLRLLANARASRQGRGRDEIRISIPRPRNVASGWDTAAAPVRRNGEWSVVEAVIDVPGDATTVELALIASGTADVTFDELRLEARAAPANSTEPLHAGQRETLVTLIELIGYLRFFYPGDVSAQTDWQAVAVDAVDRMLAVRGTADMQREVTELLRHVAPEAAVYAEGSAPPPIGPTAAGSMLTRWVHVGLGGSEPYWTFRTGMDEPSQVGMRVTLRKPLAELGPCKRATAQLVVDKMEGQPRVQLEVAPIVAGIRAPPQAVVLDAVQASSEVEIPAEAYGVQLGVFTQGFGSIDVARLTLSCDGRQVVEVRPDSSVVVSGVANHLYTLVRNRSCGKAACMHIERKPLDELTADDVLDVSLGSGMRLRMPLAVSTDGKRTLPEREPMAVTVQLPASTRASRLAAVLDLWIMLRWFYPHFTDLGIDWRAAIGPALDEAARAATSDAQRHALSRLTYALRDGHARVLRPEIDDGLLPVMFRSIDDKIVVAATMTPAEAIPLGSTLVAIDGVLANEARRRASELMSASTPAFQLRHSTYGLGYGREATFSHLVLREPGAARDVTRVVPHLDRGELVPRLREVRPASGTELASGLQYVDLHTLDDATWTSMLPKLARSTAIVFDLRGYVGPAAFTPLSYLSDREIRSPTFLMPLVVPSGPVRYEQIVSYTPPRKAPLRAKAIFLVDARTASAPETILQIVRGERLGVIIGEPTGGTNGNIIEYRIVGGMSMRFTGMRVLNHDGSVFQGHGIVPDVIVHPTLAGITAGRDEVLEAAVKYAEREYTGRLP
jgi:hypothetical protein